MTSVGHKRKLKWNIKSYPWITEVVGRGPVWQTKKKKKVSYTHQKTGIWHKNKDVSKGNKIKGWLKSILQGVIEEDH